MPIPLALPVARMPSLLIPAPFGSTLPPLIDTPPSSPSGSSGAPDPNALPAVFQSSPIPLGHGLLVGGAVDLRTRTATTGRTSGVWVNNTELDFQHPITSNGHQRGNIVLQIIAEDPPDIPQGGRR